MRESICWICGCQANSREHVIKKSDIVRAYGRKLMNKAVHVKNNVQHLLQSPNSTYIKYDASLCHNCNTTVTQPFDRAYDRFIDYIHNNEDDILRKRFIDFYDVYGNSFELGQRNLYNYFAKSFGCRVYAVNHKVPEDVVELIGKTYFETGLRVNFCVSEDVLLMPKNIRDGFIGKGDLIAHLDKNDISIVNGYTCNEHLSWLLVSCWYNIVPNGALGSIWVADNRFIYLGCHSSLTEDQKQYMINKLDNLN